MPLRWKILIAAFVARTGLGVQFQSLAAVAPELQADLAIGYGKLGLLIGLFMLAGVFLSFPAGMLGRFVSDRGLIIGGFVFLSAGALIAASSNAFGLLAVGRVICGFGFVLGTLYFVKLIADHFDGRELATAMGLLVMSWPVGIACAQVFLPLVSLRWGWESALVLCAVWNGVGIGLLVYFVPAKNKASVSVGDGRDKAALLSRRYLQLTLLAAFVWGVFNAGLAVYLSFINIRLLELGYSQSISGLLASVPGWLMPFSAIAVGQYSDRTGSRDNVIYLSAVAAVVSMLLLAYTSIVLPALILFGLVGAASAGVIMSLTSEAIPADARAFGMGVFFTLYFALNLPAPAVAGWLLDVRGNAVASLTFAAALFALTAIGTLVFRMQVERK